MPYFLKVDCTNNRIEKLKNKRIDFQIGGKECYMILRQLEPNISTTTTRL